MTVRREFVPSIDPDQWSRLARFFASNRKNVMPHELVAAAGIASSQAVALLNQLARDGSGRLFVVVYHRSCEESTAPAALFPWSEGLPSLPIRCEHCCREVHEREALRFGMTIKIDRRVELE